MRVGGAFPFSPTQPIESGGVVLLPSGGIFYPPAGNYIGQVGETTVMEMWDPVSQSWRLQGTGYQAFDTDGFNWRMVNYSGIIRGALITAAGSGGTNGIGAVATNVSISLTAPTAPGVTATAYPIVGGAVVAPTVAQAGTGFLLPPLVVIDQPPVGGIQATAIATLASVGGGIASITMTNPGAGYLTAPNFYLIPQPGSYQGGPTAGGAIAAGLITSPSQGPGQVATANQVPGVVPLFTLSATAALLNPATLTGSGTLTGIVMVNYGSLYTGTTIPTVSIIGCGAAAATAIGSFVMTGVSSLVAGAGYGAGTPPIWETSLGLVAGTYNNNVLLPREARGVTTLSGGTVATVVIEDPGFALQKVPIAAMFDTSADNSALATFVPVIGGVTDVSLLQSRVSS